MNTAKLLPLLLIIILLSSCSVVKRQEDKPILYSAPATETTISNYIIINENTVDLSTVDIHIPENFEIDYGSDVLVLEDENIELSIEDKTTAISSFDEYISQTTDYLSQMGVVVNDVEELTINNNKAKKVLIESFDIKNRDACCYLYFVEVNNSKIVITLSINDKAEISSEQADTLVSTVEIL